MTNNMASDSDLFLFGDDLDAVLEALEADNNVNEYFDEAVTEIQKEDILCNLCSKKCRSLSGLKRHMTCKHRDILEDNEPDIVEGQQREFTAEILARMVEEVKYRLVNNKVHSKAIREELSGYQFTNISEETKEFRELQSMYQNLMKKKDQEKFYAVFYSTVPLNSTRYFTGLSRNSATLMSTKLADAMLAHSKDRSVSTVNNFKIELTEKEIAGLQYVGGYVLHKLHNRHTQSKLCKSSASQQTIAILKAGKEKEQSMSDNQKLTTSLNRGGLWTITKPAQTVFIRTEKYFRFYTSDYPIASIDITEIRSKTINDGEVLIAFSCMKANSELKVCEKVAKDVLQSIVDLYIRVRSFSFAKDVVQKYKVQMKLVKEKALRKQISRASKVKDYEHRHP